MSNTKRITVKFSERPVVYVNDNNSEVNEVIKALKAVKVPLSCEFEFEDAYDNSGYSYICWDGAEICLTDDYEEDDITTESGVQFIEYIFSERKVKEVYLNDEYTAEVSATDVVVGCQRFTMDVVEEIVVVSKSLR